jgi:hypothetical protein
MHGAKVKIYRVIWKSVEFSKRYYGFAAGSTAAEELTTIDLFRTRIAIMANEVLRLIWKAFEKWSTRFQSCFIHLAVNKYSLYLMPTCLCHLYLHIAIHDTATSSSDPSMFASSLLKKSDAKYCLFSLSSLSAHHDGLSRTK